MAFEYSFQSCRVREGASEFDGLRGFKGEVKLEGGKPVFTNRMKAVAHTKGQKSIAGSMKMLLRTAIVLYNKGNVLDTEHSITVSLAEGSNTDKLSVVSARFTGWPADLNGNEETEVEIPFNALDFLVNDVSVCNEIEDVAT